MLVLTAKPDEAILIGDNIYVRAYREGTTVRIAVEAPKTVRITRIPAGNIHMTRENPEPKAVERSKRRLIR